MKFIYYYKEYNGDPDTHEYEIYAANKEAANRKWANYKVLHNIVDITKEQEAKSEEKEGKVHG